MKPTGNVRPMKAVRRDEVSVRIAGRDFLLVRLSSGKETHRLYEQAKDALGNTYYREVPVPPTAALLEALFHQASH